MGTFLTTAKMSPALRARVDASVHGKRVKQAGSTIKPRLVALVRFTAVAALVALVASMVMLHRRDKREFEAARAALLDKARADRAELAPGDDGAVARVEPWLTRGAGAYEGDVSDLHGPAIAQIFAKPIVYVRGPIALFHGSSSIAGAAAMSTRDPLVLCLVSPPSAKTEKGMIETVRAAYAGGAAAEKFAPNVRRLDEAEVGLPFLTPAWSNRVAMVEEPGEAKTLQRAYDKAPIARAREAAHASVLVYAIDEDGDGKAPAELDGERPHAIRVGVVDLAAGKVLFRARKTVDPSWISTAHRADFAGGLDGCALAMDLRATMNGATITGAPHAE